MLEMKIINGNSLIITLGIYNEVRIKGNKIIDVSTFLKNSISSNRFNIKPKPINIKITLEIDLK
tara:strand:- start:99 stop:290 length:192 start_codon:yes stop_codon:yes gene_type:complete